MPRWKFILADSDDLRIHIAELMQARSRSVSIIHNRPGSLSFTFPMDDDLSASIEPITTAVKAYRFSSKTKTWKLKWSGPVWTIDESIHESRMTVTCVGWLEILNKRLLREAKTYANTDDADIILNLLDQANLTSWTNPPQDMAFTVPIPAGSYPNTPTRIIGGQKLPNEGTGGATAYTTALRNRTYARYQNIGAAITELTELENGCDFEITPEDRILNIYRKKQTITSQVFGYGWGPENLQQFQRQLDSSVVSNHMLVTGKAGTTPAVAHTSGWASGSHGWPGDTNPDTLSQFGLMEEVVSLPDVSDSSVLLAYAGAEVFFRYRPRIVFSMTPFVFVPGGSVPEPFEDYSVGDTFYLTVKSLPRVSIQNQRVRVFGISVTIDEEGNERIGTLQTAPS